MKTLKTIADKKLDSIVQRFDSDNYYWDTSKIIIDGILYYRESIVTNNVSTKSTASSLIKKEPDFDYSFMDEVYRIIDENGFKQIEYARPQKIRKDVFRGKPEMGLCKKCKHGKQFEYQIDLHSAYPHILNYEKLPIDGMLYVTESKDRMNFYKYDNEYKRKFFESSIVTDDLKNYIESNNMGKCTFLFSTDYKVGSKLGKKLIEMVYKNVKTKMEAKLLHYGYYQKKFLQISPSSPQCFIRNPKYNHELLMVAVMSQLTYIMLNIADIFGDNGGFITDAYFFNNEFNLEYVKNRLASMFPNYDYRIVRAVLNETDSYDKQVLFKSYPDLPDAPRSHKKKGE